MAPNAMISGADVGNRVGIRARAVVTRSVPGGVVVAGVPARIVGAPARIVGENLPTTLTAGAERVAEDTIE
jgi:serine acetyltransferase